MKKVTGWITSDKQFFTDLEIAMNHEIVARQKLGIENLIKRNFEGSYQNYAITTQLTNFIYENRGALLEFLEDEYVKNQVEEDIYD